jgi:Protein of unknown function (DUF3489)
MAQLSDSQLVLLSAACQRPDRSVYPLTAKLPGGAAAKVLGSLLKKGLVREVQAKREDTVWLESKKRGRLTLRVTPAAFEALGIDQRDAPTRSEGDSDPPAERRTRSRGNRQSGKSTEKPSHTRANSKQAQLIQMLNRPEGATIQEIVTKLKWQAHTVRGAFAGALKKRLGLKVESEKVEGRGRVYRLR